MNTLLLLLQYPEQLAAVRDDAALLMAAGEEARRLIPPVSFAERWTRQPVLVGGVSIPAGEFIGVSILAANRIRKPSRTPVRFDIRRKEHRPRACLLVRPPHVPRIARRPAGDKHRPRRDPGQAPRPPAHRARAAERLRLPQARRHAPRLGQREGVRMTAGHTAIVTGANHGIGAATAARWPGAGARSCARSCGSRTRTIPGRRGRTGITGRRTPSAVIGRDPGRRRPGAGRGGRPVRPGHPGHAVRHRRGAARPGRHPGQQRDRLAGRHLRAGRRPTGSAGTAAGDRGDLDASSSRWTRWAPR